jgi:hypothetical protein
MTERSHRLPVSTRRAFALAFDLAARRDPLQSLVIPLLLRAPWALTLALLPPLDTVDDPSPTLALGSLALLGDFITWLLISAMLRIRAQSAFNTPRAIRPAPVGECYSRGLRRTPWLLMTEVVRNAMLGIAAYCSFLPTAYLRLGAATFFRDLSHNFLQIAAAVTLLMPTLFLGFRLGVATEAVVLTDRDLGSAFQRSFGMMQGRFERWFELVVASGVTILALAMIVSVVGVLVPGLSDTGQVSLFWLLVIAATPIIQYAWTFFYLRLVEAEQPIIEVGPTYAQVPEHPPAPAALPPVEMVEPASRADHGNGPQGADA